MLNNEVLEVKIKMPYLFEKKMKKLAGQHTARQIAFGRKLCKTLQSKYGKLKPTNECQISGFQE